ncbi:MAG: RNA 2',3'-cyclic phosphodiesterase [Planctomycetes bacterium]|nr:RNA 2',3'-cyclic phosphodiesterase [Planctomycetota bacterium]
MHHADAKAESTRLFVALPLPRAATERLALEIGELRRIGADVRWTDPRQAHVTLAFLGAVAVDRLEPLRAALRAVSWPLPIALALHGLGRFPARGPARVIWAGFADVPGGSALAALRELAARLARTLAPFKEPRATRPFHPHVTLGRVRGPHRLWELEASLAQRAAGMSLTLEPIDQVVLYASELTRDGARYAVVQTLPSTEPSGPA